MSRDNTKPNESDGTDSCPSKGPGGLCVCTFALVSLSFGIALTMYLLRNFGVVATSGGILALFALPLFWTICRRDNRTADEPPGAICRSLDHTWVVSFWCVCTVVILAVADLV